MVDTQIIDGKAVAAQLRTELANEVKSMSNQPGLAVILVGDDPASKVYVGSKIRACEQVGIKSYESRLSDKTTEAEIAAEIKAFDDNKDVHGILLQLPLPYPLDSDALIQSITPEKDVDGLTYLNAGKLVAGDQSGIVPCTPQGSLMLIKSVEPNLRGKKALVIGRSLLFGKPMAQLLLAEDCTVTTAHRHTQDLEKLCQEADILVAAVGQPKMVKGEWIKPGAIVIDVGINRLDDGSLCGDVDYEAAQGIAGAITPVPGGVGPMTIACLLKNTIETAKIQNTVHSSEEAA